LRYEDQLENLSPQEERFLKGAAGLGKGEKERVKRPPKKGYNGKK